MQNHKRIFDQTISERRIEPITFFSVGLQMLKI